MRAPSFPAPPALDGRFSPDAWASLDLPAIPFGSSLLNPQVIDFESIPAARRQGASPAVFERMNGWLRTRASLALAVAKRVNIEEFETTLALLTQHGVNIRAHPGLLGRKGQDLVSRVVRRTGKHLGLIPSPTGCVRIEHPQPSPRHPPLPSAEWLRLLRDFQQTGDPAIRNRLMLDYLPQVRFEARCLEKKLPLDAPRREELESYGVDGLIAALKSYNPGKGASFNTYCRHRIRGAMLDEIRSLNWTPRWVRERADSIQSTLSKLQGGLGRRATWEELGRAFKVPPEKVEAWLFDCLRAPREVALIQRGERAFYEEPGGEVEHPLPDTKTPSAESQLELRDLWGTFLRGLKFRERAVMMLSNLCELETAQIAKMLGIANCRVTAICREESRRAKERFIDGQGREGRLDGPRKWARLQKQPEDLLSEIYNTLRPALHRTDVKAAYDNLQGSALLEQAARIAKGRR